VRGGFHGGRVLGRVVRVMGSAANQNSAVIYIYILSCFNPVFFPCNWTDVAVRSVCTDFPHAIGKKNHAA
jgi:hypothetical protein